MIDQISVDEITRLNKLVEYQRDLLERIQVISDHQIPYYGYGENQAACDMAYRLSQIFAITKESK